MHQTFVSVIVPTYNREKILSCCLEAVLASNYSYREIIVVDDASNDKTVSIAKSYGVIVIQHDKNRGAASCRNRGAQEAKGDLFIFLDSDVIVFKDTISNIVTYFDQFPQYAALTLLPSSQCEARGYLSQYKNLFVRESMAKQTEDVWHVWTSCAAVRKDAFVHVGGFDARMKGAGVEDADLGLRLVQKNYRIGFAKTIEVRHDHQWRLFAWIKNDFYKGRDYIRMFIKRKIFLKMALSRGKKVNNTGMRYSVGIPSALLFLILVILWPWLSVEILGPWMLGVMVIYFLSQYQFLTFLKKERNVFFMIRSIPFLFFGMMINIVSMAFGCVLGGYDRLIVKDSS